MGTLELTTAGPVYLDTNGFIYSVERTEPYFSLLEPLWREAGAGRFTVVSSELAVMESVSCPLSATL